MTGPTGLGLAGHARPPEQVMRLSRLGAQLPCRLGFARQLTRRMARRGWRIACADWALDAAGAGHAVYSIDTGARRYAVVAVTTAGSGPGPAAGAILVDGLPGPADIARLADALRGSPAPRLTARELCLVQLAGAAPVWERLIDTLAAGQQPDAAWHADAGGVLLRATAVHAAGRCGTADHGVLAHRPELHAPFQAELLTLYLARVFARDLADHLARARGGDGAARLDPGAAGRLGIGTTIGADMAPFLVAHPCLCNNWVMAREEAIARVSALPAVTDAQWQRVAGLAARLGAGAGAALAADLPRLGDRMAAGPRGPRPWVRLLSWADTALSAEGQEALASLMLEPYGALVDGLGHCMSDALDSGFRIDGAVPVARMRELIEGVFGPAPARSPEAEAAADGRAETPAAVARDAGLARRAMAGWPGEAPVAAFLLRHPEHRRAIRRAQIAGFAPYSEIRDDLGAEAGEAALHALVRAILAFLGATDVVPQPGGAVRGRLFAGAPYPETLATGTADLWPLSDTRP
ncbi:hypothetical protein HCU73_09335 [Roseibacterium sp. KMU-115]|uniref:Uncharacterized protein n=2 Tax=Roseicyclus persicicus TaxID=2650661 RepID=A0A7X6GYK6_9RHOB|nr:hypothetical protein [Roseibacterium persicicum]